MKYLQSIFFKFQLLAQSILLLILILLPEGTEETFLNVIAVGLLVLIGIPHGANDLLYRKNKSPKGAFIFLVLYLGSMALYGVLWWFFPVVALGLFLIISVHHFGQSNFESTKSFHPPALMWGLWLLGAPVMIHFDESFAIFSDMTAAKFSHESWDYILWILRYALLAVYLILSIRRYSKAWPWILMQAALIAIWYEFSPLLSGFIIIFTLWHSSQSLFYQWKHYSEMKSPKPSISFFIANMFLFTIIAALFLYLISLILPLTIGVLFILLSIITLPHVIVMDGIYKKDGH